MFKIKNTSENEIFYATELSAGFDICSNQYKLLDVGERHAFSTGLVLEEDKEWGVNFDMESMVPELQIRSRSGLAFKNGVSVCQGVGTVDADYLGNEIKVILINHGTVPYEVNKGDRIAQGVIGLALRMPGVKVKTDKRTGGLGSTGVK